MENIRVYLKKLKDFILCCRKTLEVVEDIHEDVTELVYKPTVVSLNK